MSGPEGKQRADVDDLIPSLVYVSTESYRMYRAMCKEIKVDEADKTDSQKLSLKPKELPFSRYVQAYLFAAAIGLRNDRKLSITDKKRWLIRGEYLSRDANYEKFRQLIKSIHSPLSEAELVGLLTEYAEVGVRELYDEYSKTGKIDFARFSESVEAPG